MVYENTKGVTKGATITLLSLSPSGMYIVQLGAYRYLGSMSNSGDNRFKAGGLYCGRDKSTTGAYNQIYFCSGQFNGLNLTLDSCYWKTVTAADSVEGETKLYRIYTIFNQGILQQ